MPGLPGGLSSTRETHLFALKGHLWVSVFLKALQVKTQGLPCFQAKQQHERQEATPVVSVPAVSLLTPVLSFFSFFSSRANQTVHLRRAEGTISPRPGQQLVCV